MKISKKKIDLVLRDHYLWINSEGGKRANLQRANLRRANLEGANLDLSCWPLWCGSKKVKVDAKIGRQLLAHFCTLDCEDNDLKKIQNLLTEEAKKSHVSGYLLN